MRIAITGARSDIAKNIQFLAADSGDTITLAPPSKELNFLTSQEKLAVWLDRCAPDVVVHLAGSKPPAPVTALFANNVAVTYNLLEAMASASPAARLVFSSSSAVYGQLAVDEIAGVGTTVRPVNAYGYSKAAQEDLAFRFCHLAGRRLVIARIFNMIGTLGDDYSVLPSLVRRSIASLPGALMTVKDGYCVRDFIDVVDVASALLLACKADDPPEVMNICSEIPVSIMQLATLVSQRLGRTIAFDFQPGNAHDTIIRSVGDASETRGLGWERKRSLVESIDETIRRISKVVPIAPKAAPLRQT
ncbi:MAG TPA: NAD(P)-dependent oxidoreductase [Candidatus Rubrimentiphilum sp.]|nr:NAD(P)-dependent oxidoreductase [Candidatus Rubrimentiphilum sp.]